MVLEMSKRSYWYLTVLNWYGVHVSFLLTSYVRHNSFCIVKRTVESKLNAIIVIYYQVTSIYRTANDESLYPRVFFQVVIRKIIEFIRTETMSPIHLTRFS